MEEETHKWCRVSVRIESDELHPDVISACLGAQPSFGGAIGDRLSHRNPQSAVRTSHLWGWSCPLPPEADLQELCEAALQWIESRREAWLKILDTSDTEAELFVGYSSTSGQGGFVLPPEMLRRMVELKLHLGLDLYPPETACVIEPSAPEVP